jgi:hypothetical protein
MKKAGSEFAGGVLYSLAVSRRAVVRYGLTTFCCAGGSQAFGAVRFIFIFFEEEAVEALRLCPQ